MLKENKSKIILSSIVILLPILFGLIMWSKLPDTMITHWGADGNADGTGAKVFTVFGLPVILLAVHFLCLFFTLMDKQQKGQSKKALNMIFWIVPTISLLVNGIVYAIALGKAIDFMLLIPALFGIMLVGMGNYLPKIKQNRTLGIKVSWTLANEENWNKTHRFGGRIWVIGGLVTIFSICLPPAAMVSVFVCVLMITGIAPILYSYGIYRKHRKEGISYQTAPRSKTEKTAVRISAVVGAIVLIGITVLMFTGDIEVYCGETSLQIEASYWADLEVDYAEIDTVTYHEELNTGIRTNGFGTARLAMGNFQNEEFGDYTLYAYTGAEGYIVLEAGEKILVIGLKDADDTRKLYQSILEKRD